MPIYRFLDTCGGTAPLSVQQRPAVNSNSLLSAKKKKKATIKHALCAMHHNDSHKKQRVRGIPAAISEREAYV